MASLGDPKSLWQHVLVAPRPIPWLGLTWLRRGPAYWARRVSMTLFLLFVNAVAAGMAVGFAVGCLERTSRLGSAVFLCAYGALFLAVGFAMTRGIVRSDRSDAPAQSRRRRATAAGASRGVAAALGSMAAGVLVILAVPAALGGCLPLLVRSFGRYWLGERQARRLAGLES